MRGPSRILVMAAAVAALPAMAQAWWWHDSCAATCATAHPAAVTAQKDTAGRAKTHPSGKATAKSAATATPTARP